MSKFKNLIKTTLTPIVLCLTLVIAVPALSKKGYNQEHDDMRQILSELSLTDAQKQDIRQISKQNREDRGLFSSDVKSLKQELRNLVQTSEWDLAAVESAITESQTLIQTNALQRATNKNRVWNLLTEAQQDEFVVFFDALRAERKGKGVAGWKEGKRKGKKLKRLDLSESQLAAVSVIKNKSEASGKKNMAKLKVYKQAEHLLVQSADFNAETWQTLNNEYRSDFLSIAILKVKTQYYIWNQLTPEQQAKASEKMKEKRSIHRKKGKKHQESSSI
jgi:Spy/CpxP family protein refolding chaperone